MARMNEAQSTTLVNMADKRGELARSLPRPPTHTPRRPLHQGLRGAVTASVQAGGLAHLSVSYRSVAEMRNLQRAEGRGRARFPVSLSP